MTTTGLQAFDTSIRKTNSWLKDVMRELGGADRQEAYRALRATLQALRDRLSVSEVAQLSAQLPMLVRGFFLEGWSPGGGTEKTRTEKEFLRAIQAHYGKQPIDARLTACAVFKVLSQRISEGEIQDVKGMLPKPIQSLWPVKGAAVYLGEPEDDRTVGKFMTRGVLYADADRPLTLVLKRMNEERIRHVLVVAQQEIGPEGEIREQAIQGILTTRDVLRSLQRRADKAVRLDDLLVRDVMTAGPLISIGPDAGLQQAALLMGEKRISALPVVVDGLLRGMITSEDLLLASGARSLAGAQSSPAS